MKKVLNLYAGIGGNRKLWPDDLAITSVEFNPDIASIYKSNFPNDTVIVGDAHQYLLDHHHEFDFIWASPPCQSHSSFRQNICVRFRGTDAKYPEMSLYQEIIFLKHNCKCLWVVENVRPYYEPLIIPDFILQRHLYWGNFRVLNKQFKADMIRTAQIPDLEKKYGYDLSGVKLSNKRQVLRNCVDPEIGLHIFNEAFRSDVNKPLVNQMELFQIAS